MRAACVLFCCLFLAACSACGPFPGCKAYGGRVMGGEGRSAGIDYDAPVGTPVIAAAAGVVEAVAAGGPADGLAVTLRHVRFRTRYAPLSRAVVTPGRRIARGELLGFSGVSDNHGRAGEAHLLFALCRPEGDCRLLSETMNPADFWLEDSPQCFDPARDYSGAGEALTLPLACGAHAGALRAGTPR
jgi:hypothetical protein